MIVKPLDFAVVQQMNEVSQIKQHQDHRPLAEQQTITTQVQKDTDTKAEQVNQKDNADHKNKKYDAKDKSQNEYHKEKGSDKKKRQTDEGKVSIKGQNSMEFDIRI